MKKITFCLVLWAVMLMVAPVHAVNFYWKSSTTDLNAIATPVSGDRGIVVTDAGVVSYWTYSGSAWVQAFADLPALGPIFAAATTKTTPVDADEIPLSNSESSGVLNALSWANLKATLESYFNTVFTAKNTAITGSTKTKITYDAKGLITSGADATTADVADSTDKRYCTDAQKTVIGNTSGTNSGNETVTTSGSLINGATAKATPVDADMIGLMDSAASNVVKKLSWSNIKATLKTYFDGVYEPDQTVAQTAEMQAGTETATRAVSPALVKVAIDNLGFKPATPGAIGGTTPAAGTFTTLSAGVGGFGVDADGDVTGKSFSSTAIDGSRRLELTNNTTAWSGCSSGIYGMSFDAGVLRICEDGTKRSILSILVDPGANKLRAWDDTDNADQYITIGSNLSYDHATHTLNATAGGGNVTKVGTPSNYQWGVWTGDGTLKGVSVTGSKVACTNVNGEPVACTNLTDVVPLVSGGALGTPSSATLTNATGLPLSGITTSTSAAIGVGSVELGHASDTTIARSSAGVVTVEGVAVARTIVSGTSALGTSAIASGACATPITTSATGAATTDVIQWGFNTRPSQVTGYAGANTTGALRIDVYPTAGNVNFEVCNQTASAITPGAITLNWRIVR